MAYKCLHCYAWIPRVQHSPKCTREAYMAFCGWLRWVCR